MWPDLLATALVGTARSGEVAEAVLDAAAAHALRRRAGVAVVLGARPPLAAPVEAALPVGRAAAARADALLALDRPTREATPVRDMPSRLELLAEWLEATAAAGRRLPSELVPALLDVGRRHHGLRPLIPAVAGPLAGWLAAQRPDWAYASATHQDDTGVDDDEAWELGPIGRRVSYLTTLRRRDPGRGRELLAAAWDAEPPDDRAALLGALATGLADDDEPLLERALDDRRRQVRAVALDLFVRLSDCSYSRRMAARALACVDVREATRIAITPPTACDRSMVRDGILQRPPAGIGERAWWLEEILARTRLSVWPGGSGVLVRIGREWKETVLRGMARAAVTQRDPGWAAALLDPFTADVTALGHPGDRLLIEALHDALPTEDLAARATAVLGRGVAGAMEVGVDHLLRLCPRPWPPAVADAVFAALANEFDRGRGWRVAGLCDLAALRLPAGLAPRGAALLERLRTVRGNDPAVKAVERFAATLRFRRDMLEELE
jgi:hypothetical protein